VDPFKLLDLFMLALCIWREARGESYLGKLYVGQTIENRDKDPRWPNTIVGVITQKLQFSAFNSNDPNALLFPLSDSGSWSDCVRAAEEVLKEDIPFTSANHYHTKNVKPKWADSSKIVTSEGAHIFYRL
jgi:N-acetylmuramoyl-L-alanine amidase